jgi:hypothetical protein
MWIRVGQQRQSTLILNKVLTSVDRLDYNKSVAVVCNEGGHLMMYLALEKRDTTKVHR